jgi:nicotinate dehydrogenase subunit A
LQTFHLTVNGRKVDVTADGDTPLLYILRNDLGLKGARFGCGLGLCGSCSVIVDGRAINSCDTPVWSVDGKSVETVEGLAKGDKLHPVQKAILAEQAGQCGYCLSGIIMRAKAFLDVTPEPSRAQIAEALDPSLCRCGAHDRILRAVQRAAKEMAGGASA